jgi:hypothetical protein
MPNDQILKHLTKINKEMNEKYNSFNHLDKLQCIEEEEILKLEKKFDPFSIDKSYNYLINIIKLKNCLPDINLDLSKIMEFYKNSTSNSVDELVKEIFIFNSYYERLTKYINMNKIESIKEKCVIYYLFYFMSRAFFYVIMNNNFMVTKENCNEFIKFFTNYSKVTKAAKLYLKDSIEHSSIIVDDENKKEITRLKRAGLCDAFKQLKKYPNEFKEAVLSCHNFLILIIFSSEKKEENENFKGITMDKDMSDLLEIFVVNMDLLYNVNKYFSLIDYKNFYNDGVSKNISIHAEFKTFENNENIREQIEKIKKEYKKDKGKEDISDEVEKNFDKEIKDMKKEIKFTLLDYMWLFNPAAKNTIILLFNERQKKSEVIKSVNQTAYRMPILGFGFLVSQKDIFLTINIRRKNLIEDTLNELSKPGIKLQNPIRVKFIGEQAVDEGGVRKEFFLLFIRQIFDPDYGMFNYNKNTRFYWFNHYTFEPKIKYELIGIIFGLAIYNNIILDVKFPLVVYKKLLGYKLTIEDMKECDPELYSTLSFLIKSTDKNLKDSLEQDFTVVDDKFGEKLTIPLKPDGDKIMVDIDNKDEYVELYLDWYFNKSIKEVFASFERGFYRVFNRDLSKVLSAEELELIICGTQVLDFNELKKNCHYEEYTENSETIKYFWEILLEFNEEEKKKFLSFVTGCDRAPIDGLGSLPITVSNGGTKLNQLPSAHTCFNNLILPDYKNKEVMRKKIHIAMNYSEGFGLI